MVRRLDLPDALDRDAEGGPKQRKRHDQGRQRLRLPVAVRMVLVRRLCRIAQPEPYDERGDHIRTRLDRVRHERVGAAENPGGRLDEHEQTVDPDADQRGAHPPVCRVLSSWIG